MSPLVTTIDPLKTCCSEQRSSVPEAVVWQGHVISRMDEAAKTVVSKVGSLFQNVLTCLTALTSDIDKLSSILSKFHKYIFDAIEKVGRIPGYFKRLKISVGHGVGVMDALRVIDDVDYFANKKFKKDSGVSIASRITLAATNAGGAALWLGNLGLLNLQKLSVQIGSTRLFKSVEALKDVRVFSFVPKVTGAIPRLRDIPKVQAIAVKIGNLKVFGLLSRITLEGFVQKALCATFILVAIDSLQKLVGPGNVAQKTQAGIELASSVSELALEILASLGALSVVGLGVIGAGCAALAASSLFHSIYHENELKQPRKVVAQPMTSVV